MKITIPEGQIAAPQINGSKILTFKVRVKREDYTQEMFDELCNAADRGTLVAVALASIEGTDDSDEKRIGYKRSRLAFLMKTYCESETLSEVEEVSRIYKKYSVSSRAELTEEQLNAEIDSYQAGLHYNT